ncbi:hypothetical protein [Nitriliruptor alkaliphilus]|uniref:hypothetical protein n=1 Tax=Nitriliruptor alkaliphilus TaxID=427918 RepID=UPI00069728A5|nr:hypothetical protein [Nitriliruptor alkaliphilus]
MRAGDDDFDPWSDTTPGAAEVRDDPFDSWPTDSTMGEITGPFSTEGLIARAARGGALPRRRHAAWLGVVAFLVGILSMLVLGVVLAQ